MSSISAQSSLNSSSSTLPPRTVVAPASNASFAATAVSLASEAGVVVNICGAPLPVYTYDATGLFNSLVLAGTSASAAQGTVASPAASQASVDQTVLGSLSGASASPIPNSSLGLPVPIVNVSANFASILKTNPGIAGNVINDSLDQGIIASISAVA